VGDLAGNGKAQGAAWCDRGMAYDSMACDSMACGGMVGGAVATCRWSALGGEEEDAR